MTVCKIIISLQTQEPLAIDSSHSDDYVLGAHCSEQNLTQKVYDQHVLQVNKVRLTSSCDVTVGSAAFLNGGAFFAGLFLLRFTVLFNSAGNRDQSNNKVKICSAQYVKNFLRIFTKGSKFTIYDCFSSNRRQYQTFVYSFIYHKKCTNCQTELKTVFCQRKII